MNEQLKAAAQLVQRNYEKEMSAGDDAQFQALVDLGDMAEEIIALCDALALPRWRHRVRGTDYLEIGTAQVQAERPIPEGTEVVVYQGAGGQLWVRPVKEFNDGRFYKVGYDTGVSPAGHLTLRIASITGYVAESEFTRVTPDQYGDVMLLLHGKGHLIRPAD